MSDVACNAWIVARHTSHVTRHTSHVTRHTSPAVKRVLLERVELAQLVGHCIARWQPLHHARLVDVLLHVKVVLA